MFVTKDGHVRHRDHHYQMSQKEFKAELGEFFHQKNFLNKDKVLPNLKFFHEKMLILTRFSAFDVKVLS